jgi:small subunit ribosomal protein S7e
MAGKVSKKIVKAKGQAVTPLEKQVAKAIEDMADNNKDLSGELSDLFITAAKEVTVTPSKKAIVIFVPFKFHKRYQKIQDRLVRELEKKFNDHHVVFIAQRTILSASHIRSSNGALRPRSRTLTSVHEAILDDVVYPVQIVGKRTRVRVDGTKLLKVILDPNQSKEVDFKLKTFAAVYKKLTNKAVEFQFPIQE